MAMVQPVDMAVKANQILARFRPIAPKPAALPTSPAIDGAAAVAANTVLCHLQTRPCRARKRGRQNVAPVSPSSSAKRNKRPVYPMPLRCAAAAATDAAVATATRAHVSVAVPPTACMPLASLSPGAAGQDEEEEERDVPVERDLLRKLLEPKVISPRAVRPVGSTIHIASVAVHAACTDATGSTASSKTAEEVEAELEADALPAVVSDSSNRVRLVNDKYKEMVGAPECTWLGALARRISGEVALVVPAQQPDTRGGFSCAAKIEWERGGGERASVHAACDVTRLHCDSRDYIYAWRFRTADASSSVSTHRSGDA
ncbi:uncharacterized protein LOC124670292 [Lolium rigidum]|uniref:uncharacterized protein LOC124670292 n=1 Tax=Lolium rigidum TaxID=89674 RepID=UPI001F5C6B2D|nr:uncharacterized protein LOC124670292 [Lolium rigidum]